MKKEINNQKNKLIDLAIEQWFELLLATIEWNRKIKINKNGKYI